MTPQDPQPQTPDAQPAIKEQPVVQAPAANYQQPTPDQQQTVYEQQPVQQQYFAQPNAAPVQYVVQANSLKGIKGWLAFFMIIAGLAALSYSGILISSISYLSGISQIINIVFMPLLIAGAIASVALIALEKRLARNVYIGFGTLVLLHSVISTAVGGDVTSIVAGFMSGSIWLTFVILYFMTSKRVKETLIK